MPVKPHLLRSFNLHVSEDPVEIELATFNDTIEALGLLSACWIWHTQAGEHTGLSPK